MNLVSRNGGVVHAPAKEGSKYGKCEPNGASRGGYVNPLRETKHPVTCKKCLRKA